jgi:hypothetical protein
MAFYGAITELALYALLGGLIRSTALRAFIAFVAANAALIYAYALWGGMKEIAATALIALTAALVPVRRKELRSARAQLPFAVAAAATLGVLSVLGLIWVGLLAIPALVILARNARRRWKATVDVPAAGTYSTWIEGTAWRRITLKHFVTLPYGSPALEPGATAPIYQLGPLALTPVSLPAAVRYLRPARWRSLCGELADWIEVVSR